MTKWFKEKVTSGFGFNAFTMFGQEIGKEEEGEERL